MSDSDLDLVSVTVRVRGESVIRTVPIGGRKAVDVLDQIRAELVAIDEARTPAVEVEQQ